MSLDKELKDVTSDSSPADIEPDNKDGKDGRTPDEVRGELLRKQERDKREIMERLDSIAGQLSQQLRAAPAPTAGNPGADSLDNYSLADLEAMRSKVPEENLPQYEGLLAQKRMGDMERLLDTKLQQFTQTQQMRTDRQRFNQTAVDRYPELGDLTSEFAIAVNEQLMKVPADLRERNTRIVLDLANEVAMERGVQPKSRRQVAGTAPTSSGPAPQQSDEDEFVNTDEERERLKKFYQSALPKKSDGSPGEFDDERLKATEKYIKGNIGYHIQGGKG